MSSDNLLVEVNDGIALITVNRASKLNALNRALIAELGGTLESLRRREDFGAVVVTGAGEKAFVAGADIAELAGLNPIEARSYALEGQSVLYQLENLGKPVIAAINGFALGGGLELAMACTLRVASESAILGQPEVKIGLIPGFAGTQRLPRIVGKGRALELLLTGTTISASEAWRIGLVNRVVAPEKLMTTAKRASGANSEQGTHCRLAVFGCRTARSGRVVGGRIQSRGGQVRNVFCHRGHEGRHPGLPQQAGAQVHGEIGPSGRLHARGTSRSWGAKLDRVARNRARRGLCSRTQTSRLGS